MSESHSVVSDFLRPHGLYSPRILQARILEWVAFFFSRGDNICSVFFNIMNAFTSLVYSQFGI